MSEDIEERHSSKYIDYQLNRKTDPERCEVYLFGDEFVQVGKCCTVVKVKVNRTVKEWLEKNKANQAAELGLQLVVGDLEICNILWNTKDSLQDAWRVELKSEIQKDISVSYFYELLEKLTYKSGEAVYKIARECYEKFNAKLEKILPGSITMQFSLPAQRYEDAFKTAESLRETLQTTFDGLLQPKYTIKTTISLRKIYGMCKGKSTSAAKIHKATESLFRKENQRGMYTLLCLDATEASNHSISREMLKTLYTNLLQEFDLIHSDDSVKYNEFFSLIAFGCDGKIHIEQPFLPEFPHKDSYNHIIDEVSGKDTSWNAFTVLSVIFQIATDYGKNFFVDGYVIKPRVVFLTNGKFSNTDLLTKSSFRDADIEPYPITFVPIDGTSPKDSLQKIISITHGEIRNDVGYISQYVKHQQTIIDVLKMEKKGFNEFGMDEILERIKEQSPGSVKDIEQFLRTQGVHEKISGAGELPTEEETLCS